MSNFFVDLVSNASMDFYPQNTLSKFTNKLKFPLELSDEWEVAITEIFYPHKIEDRTPMSYILVVRPIEHQKFVTTFNCIGFSYANSKPFETW